jgi:hypothetical protein
MTEWDAVSALYRKRWEEHYGAAAEAAAWERYEPRYRFAWEMSHHPNTQGKSWVMAQPALREAWQARFPDQAWDPASDTVRHGWEHAPEAEKEARAA